ncbi:hypothetical protein B0A58_03440 [Flavobacterium branchiophilum NBRC 15030 = ATCC 35035]|nr:T9SS type A sorting domain-containing protein [Flavobacterium branchiophilum]OXA79415.1 hypothetical protein B0A58_03440 [Flavobacterium branchiophilum NBRC 15030 = ATCC 35035]GEM56666.1 T9SS C-terminal target domain-containing protein [Flavobacterium branchiophilum NBRC 15030 = ATCC 35035]
MKHYTLLILLLFFNFYLNAQNMMLKQSIGGSGGLTKTYHQKYIIQNALGQSSVIGSFSSSHTGINQGFIQPLLFLNNKNAIQISVKDQFMISPNPFIDVIQISSVKQLGAPFKITIYDIMGHLIHESNTIFLNQYQLDLAFLPSGTYLAIIDCKEFNVVKKIIKK